MIKKAHGYLSCVLNISFAGRGLAPAAHYKKYRSTIGAAVYYFDIWASVKRISVL